MNSALFEQRFRAAFERLKLGDLDGALTACETLQAEAPNHPAVLQLQSALALRSNAPKEAMKWAQRSLSLRPMHVPTLILAAHAARAIGAFTRAVGFLRDATQHEPNLAAPAFLLCHMLLELKDDALDAALADAHTRFPSDAADWQALGVSLQRAGHKAASLDAFTAASIADPHLAPAQFGRGLLLRDFGRMEEARAALACAVSLAPDVAAAWFALGLTCQDLSDEAGAASAYQAALRAQPDFAEAAVNCGIALQSLGDMAAARIAYRQAIHIRPDSFGRIAQAMTASSTGMLWLDLRALRSWLEG